MKPLTKLAAIAFLGAFAAPASATGSAGFPFFVDPDLSKVYVKLTTNLGEVVLDASDLDVSGTLELDLCGGGDPVSTGIFLDGSVCTIPTIQGWIPNPIDLLPPLCHLEITNLVLAVDSLLFEVDALGNFVTDLGCEVLGGTLHAGLIDTGLVSLDLVGTVTELSPGAGAVVLVGDRLDLSVDSVVELLGIEVPLLDLDLHVGLRLDLEAYFGYPEPVRYCRTSANSAGPGAVIGSSGTTSLFRNDLELHTVGLPANQFGIYYFGPNKLSQPFGDGVRCVGGSVVRFAPVNAGASGVASMAFDHGDLPGGQSFDAGDSTNVQFWYRDPAAGAGHFNLSDALDLFFVP